MTRSGTLAGRRTLLVGGGSGIGRAVVGAYRTEGANVAVLERDATKIDVLKSEFPDVLAVEGDARSPEDCARAVNLSTERFEGLDVLVCCLGIFDFYRGIATYSHAELEQGFEEIMSVNVLGQLTPVRAALDAIKASRGSIILTGSSSSFYPGRGGVLYLASKYAIRGCVAALAHELAPHVRVNGVAPGGTIETSITGPQRLGMDNLVISSDAERIADLRALSPLKLAMRPSDHAGSYVFLASDAAAGMTGTFLHPDGGLAVRD